MFGTCKSKKSDERTGLVLPQMPSNAKLRKYLKRREKGRNSVGHQEIVTTCTCATFHILERAIAKSSRNPELLTTPEAPSREMWTIRHWLFKVRITLSSG